MGPSQVGLAQHGAQVSLFELLPFAQRPRRRASFFLYIWSCALLYKAAAVVQQLFACASGCLTLFLHDFVCRRLLLAPEQSARWSDTLFVAWSAFLSAAAH